MSEEQPKKRGRPVKDPKAKEIEYKNTERILENQALYNQTGDTKYLFNMYPDLLHAVKSLAYKRFKGYIPPFYHDTFQENVEMCTHEWMLYMKYRLEKGNPLVMKSPISMAHYMILRNWPVDDGPMNKRLEWRDYMDEVIPSKQQTTEGLIEEVKEYDTAIVSGYFVVLHRGYLRYLLSAYNTGNQLIVVINNENQQKVRFGRVVKSVDDIAIEIRKYFPNAICYKSIDTDNTVTKTLKKIKSDLPERFNIVYCTDGNVKTQDIPKSEKDVFDGNVIWLGHSKEDDIDNYIKPWGSIKIISISKSEVVLQKTILPNTRFPFVYHKERNITLTSKKSFICSVGSVCNDNEVTEIIIPANTPYYIQTKDEKITITETWKAVHPRKPILTVEDEYES